MTNFHPMHQLPYKAVNNFSPKGWHNLIISHLCTKLESDKDDHLWLNPKSNRSVFLKKKKKQKNLR